MDKTELVRRLRITFIGELEDHAREFDTQLLRLEKGTDAAEVQQGLASLLRTAHTLKGAARSVGFPELERLCHVMETSFQQLSRATLEQIVAAARALAVVVLVFRECLERLSEQRELDSVRIEAVAQSVEDGTLYTESSVVEPEVFPGPAEAPEGAESTRPAAPAPPVTTTGVDSPGRMPVATQAIDNLLASAGELMTRLGWVGTWEHRAKDLQESLRKLRRELDGNAPLSLHEVEQMVDSLAVSLSSDGRQISQAASDVDHAAAQIRMVPFAEACVGLERAVHDLAQSRGKQATLEIVGGTVELGRAIVAGLREPLLHLVRNAVDHGIERPARRRELGKPESGRVTVEARFQAAQVTVTVRDDGCGLDLDAIRNELGRRGQPIPRDANVLSLAVFDPGFSTAGKVTEISGRGLGLDIVSRRVRELRGTVTLRTPPEGGIAVVLTLPIVLAVIRALTVRVGGALYAFATSSVRKLLRIGSDAVQLSAGCETIVVDGERMPLASFGAILGQPVVLASAAEIARSGPVRSPATSNAAARSPAPESARNPGKVPVVVIDAGKNRVAIAVDAFVSEQELAVRSLGTRFTGMPHLLGAGILTDGQMVLLLATSSIVDRVLSRRSIAPVFRAVLDPSVSKRVIVADDSPTTRALEQAILESAGYQVLAVSDGAAALEVLTEHGADIVVADVEMPRMDGLALTRAIRATPRLHAVPVILVTALGREEDRANGLAAGASAYIVKSSFDQSELLECLEMLL